MSFALPYIYFYLGDFVVKPNKTTFALFSLFALSAFSSHAFAISDNQIITATDRRFCGGALANASVSPKTMSDDGSVYRVGNHRWNDAYEVKFGDWVKENVDKDFFVRHDIVTDCADAALAVRAIFARIHHLPVSFNGKMRFKIELPLDISAKEVEKIILEHELSQKWLEGKTPKKLIYVSKKIINVVL